MSTSGVPDSRRGYGGPTYVANVLNVTMLNQAQNLFEVYAAPNVATYIHSISIDVLPIIYNGGIHAESWTSGSFQVLANRGSGGQSLTASPLHPRNTVPASTTVAALVTTPGTPAQITNAFDWETFTNWQYKSNSGILVPADGLFAVGIVPLVTSLDGQPPSWQVSFNLVFEEI